MVDLRRWRLEALQQMRLALPMMGVNLMQFAIQITSVMLVGHLGELQLSSASIATSLCTVTGYSLLQGLATGLETLCGQAFGAKQYHKVGLYLYRAVLVLLAVAIPVAVLWLNMESFLLVLHQAPDISSSAGIYARWLVPGLFAFGFLQPLIKFLQAQSFVLPMFLCSSVTLAVHVSICWVLIYKVGMGNAGAALATSVSNWINVFFLAGVALLTPQCRKCLPELSMEVFEHVFDFLKLAVPSTLMFCLEWWSFESLVLLSGVLPNPKLETSVFSIMLNIINFCYMVPYGISAAASTRISNELGAGHPFEARLSQGVSFGLAAIDAVFVSTLLFCLRDVLGRAFSNEAEVVGHVSRMIPILAAMTVMDAFAGVVSGSARGCGWQMLATIANLGAFYVVGLPVGCILAFVVGLGGKGLLIGVLSGVSTQAAVLSVIALSTNWAKQAQAAMIRVDSETIPLLC
ncbi:hypothetical protein SELMODRAFT_168555 [Selaginella moellendorffii]|uniref:Protein DETOXIFICATION n=1 Tax=Selaginella moellendorffii TaxID=88036 RepID=D8R6T7_SELML|nr:protein DETOXIFICATION 17 [Selaginella moellendorffii]EFJ31772.1 hypothetical protein SELMODRAFT_168555 [Selaginella moellendorffii]|eukprot:XP_002967173.1 protein DETOXIFICATION 17 [Selaginella moellendorffii]